jgi:hypothetical protein
MRKLIVTISALALLCGCCATRPTIASDRSVETSETTRDTLIIRERAVSGVVVKPADTVTLHLPVVVEGGAIIPARTVSTSEGATVEAAIENGVATVRVINKAWRGRYSVTVADTTRQSVMEKNTSVTERQAVTERVKYTPWLVRLFFWAGLVFTALYAIKYGLKAYGWILRHR